MIASVSGRRMVKVDPAPSTVATSTLPRRPWMLRRTTSMPTPRPERLVTCSAVEKPASKIRLLISWSESVAAASISPLSIAFWRILSFGRPPPSSMTSMTMLPES
jgi:hypothetical protein